MGPVQRGERQRGVVMQKLFFKFKLAKRGGGLWPLKVFAAVDLNDNNQAEPSEEFDLKQDGLTWTGTKEIPASAKVGDLVMMLGFYVTPGVKFEAEVRKDGPDGALLSEDNGIVKTFPQARFLFLREA